METNAFRGGMLQEYLVARVREALEARRRARAAVRTRAQALQLREDVRRKLRRCFGAFPARTPLNARVTGVVERPDYRIEKVLFESRPQYFVTANLYVPRRARGPMPAVLGTCGHSQDGKAFSVYQAFARNLARQGWLTLIYDPVSQGERRQYPLNGPPPQPRGCCQEHNMAGNAMALTGDFIGLWRAWDGIRALDYLLSRPEADPSRVGVTGNSGGGTLTTYLTGLDPRFTMAAPSCFVTSYRCNAENELPADAEQIPPRILAEGLDIGDFFVAHMPRPTLLMGQKNDYFDCRGLRECHADLRRLYALFGAEEKVQLFIGPTGHGFGIENREAMYRFFNAQAGVRANARENATEKAEEESVLRVTPKGQVNAAGSRPIYDFTRERADTLAARRKALEAGELRRVLARRLQLPRRAGPPPYRVLRAQALPAKPPRAQSRFLIESEPGISVMLHLFAQGDFYHLPEAREATLYVPHLSAHDEAIAGKMPQAEMVWSVEARGVGETRPRTCGDEPVFAPYGADYFYAAHGLMLNASYAGRRVHDVLCALDLLESRGCRSVTLVGRGMGALTAAFTACLHPVVRRVTLYNALLSYHELTQTPAQSWPLSSLVTDILEDCDLPDCYRLLAAKQLTLVTPWTSRMRPWDRAPLRARLRELGLGRVRVRWE